LLYRRRDGRLIGRFNPTNAIIRIIKLQESGRQTYYFKKQHAAAATAAKKKSLALTMQKGLITCMTFIERKRQLVFCTSNGFLSFWDATVGCLIGFVRTGSAQIGICVSQQSDSVVTWPGEVDDTAYRVWDMNTRKLRCQTTKHDARALAVIEVPHHRCMVSSTLDRHVIMWPISQLKKIQFSNTKNTLLKGMFRLLFSLVFITLFLVGCYRLNTSTSAEGGMDTYCYCRTV
jgi:WD40 repeat protein